MELQPLYTIGHGNRKIELFLSILKEFKIEFLIDIRSLPYSKFNPQFNQNNLKDTLEIEGIRYVFMGETIGGRPKDISCYDNEGKVDYEILQSKNFFLQGIDRLKTAYSKRISVAIMCSESNPCECHRSKLIGKVLERQNILLKHIDEKGKIKDQLTVINEMNKGFIEFDIFGNPLNGTSNKSYL